MVTRTTRKPATTPRKPVKSEKKLPAEKKVKVVRDSFSIPQEDYALIAQLKARAQDAGMPMKKSALLRAGLQLLDKASALQFKRVLGGLTPIKTGRPKKH
jgi:hypothetical protein